jgi:hypothetical protein
MKINTPIMTAVMKISESWKDAQDLAHRPIVFIRFNPDSYEDNESEISSCWHVNTKGFCVVKKSKQKE